MLSRFKIPFFLMAMLAMPQAFLLGQQRIDGFSGLEWYKVMAGFDEYDQVKDMEQGEDGSVYYSSVYNTSLFVGTRYHADTLFQDTLVMDPQLTHGYVLKVDSAGNFQWVWLIHGAPDSRSTVSDIVFDEDGGLWAIGWYNGDVTLPGIGSFDKPLDSDGFAIRLDESGTATHFIPFWGDGNQEPKKIFLRGDGTMTILLARLDFPTYIGNDTLAVDSSRDPILGIATIEPNGNVLDFDYLGKTDSTGAAGYFQVEFDAIGNIYLVLLSRGLVASDSVRISLAHDSIAVLGYQLLKISNAHKFDWVSPIREFNSLEVVLDASLDGEIYFSAGSTRGSDFYVFVDKYTSNGNLEWQIENSGYHVYTGDIAVCKDYLYWSGRYQCDMTIDTIHFKIGERQPWPSSAETGYLCVINKHTGKLAWVISDATTNQIKGFGKIVAQEDRSFTVEANVKTTLCTIDTLTMQVLSSDVPYKMLLRIKGADFPAWPEVPDTIPGIFPDFALWPNPASREFTISVTDLWSANLTMEVYNPAGQLLLRKNLQERQSMIDPEGVASGVVFVKLKDNEHGNMRTKQLVLIR